MGRRAVVAAAGFAALSGIACAARSGEVGRFELIALEPIVPVEILAFRVERIWCGPDPVDHSRPVAAAIEDVKGANIMTNMVIVTKGDCVIARGNVGRLR